MSEFIIAHGSAGANPRREGGTSFFAMKAFYQSAEGNRNPVANSFPFIPPFTRHPVIQSAKNPPLICIDTFSAQWGNENSFLESEIADYTTGRFASNDISYSAIPNSGLGIEDSMERSFKVEEDLFSSPQFIEGPTEGQRLGRTFDQQGVAYSTNSNRYYGQLSTKNGRSADILIPRKHQTDYLAWSSYGSYVANLGQNVYSAELDSRSFVKSLPPSEDGESNTSQTEEEQEKEDQNEVESATDGEEPQRDEAQEAKSSIENNAPHGVQGRRGKGYDMDGDDLPKDENGRVLPYAKMIEMAFLSSPTRTLVLSEIYQYFLDNFPRFKTMKGRGWMNSIRHNLSMNGGFEKHPRPEGDNGKGHIWGLTEQAQREGIKSTTRFRAKASKRSAKHLSGPNLYRRDSYGNPSTDGFQYGGRPIAKKIKFTMSSQPEESSSNSYHNLQHPAEGMNLLPCPMMRSYSSNSGASPESILPTTPESYPLGYAPNTTLVNNGANFYPHAFTQGFESIPSVIPSQNDY